MSVMVSFIFIHSFILSFILFIFYQIRKFVYILSMTYTQLFIHSLPFHQNNINNKEIRFFLPLSSHSRLGGFDKESSTSKPKMTSFFHSILSLLRFKRIYNRLISVKSFVWPMAYSVKNEGYKKEKGRRRRRMWEAETVFDESVVPVKVNMLTPYLLWW